MLVPFCWALLAILPAASFSSEDICFGRLTREVIHQQEPCKCKKGRRTGSQAGSGSWHYGHVPWPAWSGRRYKTGLAGAWQGSATDVTGQQGRAVRLIHRVPQNNLSSNYILLIVLNSEHQILGKVWSSKILLQHFQHFQHCPAVDIGGWIGQYVANLTITIKQAFLLWTNTQLEEVDKGLQRKVQPINENSWNVTLYIVCLSLV